MRLLAFVSCLTLAFPAAGAVTGTIMNADGHPVAAERIAIYPLETAEAKRERHLSETPDRRTIATAESAKSGKFSVELPKGVAVAELQIEASGYAPHGRRVERDEELGGLVLSAAAMKSGRITAAGEPVAGAKVIASDDAEIVATTDLEGRYTIPDPSKWTTTITVMHRDYAMTSDSTLRISSNAKMDFTLDAGVALSGRVVGRDGKTPVAGAQIFVDGWRVATSGENGAFTVAHAPKTWEWISAKAHSLSGRRARGSDLTIRLQPSIAIAGVVRDAKTSAPVAGAEVLLLPPMRFGTSAAAHTAFSDAKGNFTMTDFVPGRYTIFALRPGYGFTPIEASLAAGEKSVRTILGSRHPRIAGMVINEQNQPVAGARLSVEPITRTGSMFRGPMIMTPPEQVVSAPDGMFIMDVGPNMDLRINARRKGLPPGHSAPVRLGEAERKSGIVITIPAGITITGRAANRDDQPLGGVQIATSETRPGTFGGIRFIFGGGGNREEDFVQTAADGTFAITLKEGRYDIAFHREGYATKVVKNHEVSNAARPLDVTLEPGVSVSGRVTREGAGVGGVTITVVGETARDSTETLADGSFAINDLTPGAMILIASKSDDLFQHNRTITAPAADISIDIPPGGHISGRVIDKETKAPVPSFDVAVSRGGGGGMVMMAPQQKPFTSDDGTFVLENVPVGAQTLIVEAAGYTTATIPSVVVEEGKSSPEITVEMDRGAGVSGRVTGADGSPLSGVAVRLSAASGRMMNRMPSFSSQAMTDGNGDYAIDAVETGERTVEFTRSGYVPYSKTVEITGRQVRVDAQLSTGVRVRGTVVTESGVPVAEAHIHASGSGSTSAFSRSDQNGTFEFEAMAPGRYTIRAEKEGFPGAELSDFDISTGAPIRLVLKSGGTIYGRVIGLDAAELAQTTVFATSTDGSGRAQTDASGNFRIEGAPVGTVRLFAMTRQAMGMSARRSPEKSVQVAAGASVQADVEFKSDTVVQGRVTRDAQPVGNAFVYFYPRSGTARTNASTTADANGYYEIRGLEDGTYNVSVSDARRGSFSTTYEVRGSGTFDVEIRSTTVRGRVIDAETGEPIGGATVDLRDRDSSRFGGRVAQTDPAGTFILESVSPGDYNVLAGKEGYGAKVTELTVGDSTSDVEVKLAPNPGVTFRVVDARDGRLVNASIRVLDSQNRVVHEPAMRWTGDVTPETTKIGLDPGSYRAVVSADGYATRDVAITAPGAHTISLSPGGEILIRSKGSEIRRARLMGADGRVYARSYYGQTFLIDPDPGVTRLEHIAPGSYTIQILGPRDEVLGSEQVVVSEAQTAVVEL